VTLSTADRLALADLVHLYAAAVDDRRFDDVIELFTQTAELRLPDPPRSLEPVRSLRGRDGVRTAMAALVAERTEHAIVGEVYADVPEPDYALGRINAIEMRPVRRLRGAPPIDRAAAAGPSTVSTEPLARKAMPPGRPRGTP
jgi:hypothetical protein